MKLLAMTLLLSVSALAALPTVNLTCQYDMVTTGGGGTTLTDLSGNGNNATFHGTSAVTGGRSFNGSSDYISMPAGCLVKNGDFTVIVIATNAANTLFYEGDATQANTMRLYSNAQFNSSGQGSQTLSPHPPTWASTEYHANYLLRATAASSTAMTTGLVDKPYRASATGSGTPSFTNDVCSSMGAQSFTTSSCTSQNSFFSGTMAYFLLYSRALTVFEINSAYVAVQATLAARPVFIADIQNTPISGPVYTRQGTLFEGGNEPSGMYETTNCQLVSNPCFKVWYSNSGNIAYAESPDSYTWTLQGTVLSGKIRCVVVKVATTYYMYIEASNANAAFDQYTSSDGITWVLANASVLAKPSDGTIFNPFVLVEGSSWYMAYEVAGGTSAGCNLATSSNGVAWTKAAVLSVTPNICQGPFLYHNTVAGIWYLWGGAAGATVDEFSAPLGLIRWQSSTFNGKWAVSSYTPLNPDSGEAVISDPSFVEANGKTYLFFGSTTPAAVKLVVSPASVSQLVLGSEGAITSAP